METYDHSEREQIEAIKKWWKDNGSSIVIGIILGLGIIFGWRGWQAYSQQQAEIASSTYERMLTAFEKDYDSQGRQEASVLMSEHSRTTYASLAALYLAKQEVVAGNLEAGHVNLKWVIEQNAMPELTQIARLRQVRLYLSENKLTEAKSSLMGEQSEQFKAAFSELKGDVAVLEKNAEVAREAYQAALATEMLSSAHLALLQMKLDDLGVKAPEFAFAQKPKSALGSPSTLQDSMVVVDKPVVTEIAPSVEPISPPESTFATPTTQEDSGASVPMVEDVDRQSALEMRTIMPVAPILRNDNYVILPSVVTASGNQWATVPNLLSTSVVMTPSELQDDAATFPMNIWQIATVVTPVTIPLNLEQI